MQRATKWTTLLGLLLSIGMLLSACGAEATPTTGALPTATTGAAAPGTATTGTAAMTPTAAMTSTVTTPTAAMTSTITTPTAAMTSTMTTPTAALTMTVGTPTAPISTTLTATSGNTSTVGSNLGQPFDPSKYQKNQIEPNATLRVSSWGDTSEQQVNRDALARFKQVYPDVTINYEPQPDNYQTKLLAQVKGGSEPDVFYVDPGLSYQFIPNNVLLDLGPAMQEVGRNASDYFSSLMGPFTANGKVYGLPKDFGSLAIFYNTDMQAKDGAPKPTAGWTQQDFQNFVKASVQGSGANKIFGFSSDPDPERWMAFALANGAKIIDNNKCAINSDIGANTLTWWYGMYKDGSATVPADVGASWSGEAFAKLRIASTAQGGWLIPFMADPASGFQSVKYDAVPLPVGTNGGKGDLLFFNAWAASAKTKYPKAAAALVLFLTSQENQDAILQTGFALPTIKGMDSDPFFQGTAVANRASKILYETAQYGTPDYYGGVNDAKIKKSLADATQRVYAGQQSPQDALNQACQEIDPLLSGGQ